MKKENISDAVIRRLPRYYRHLNELCRRGVVRISSHTLGQEMNITASQIRQDFSCFGEFGQQGYGYNVEELKAEIGHILGVDNAHHLIMVGVGNLGHALLQNFPFTQCGFTADAAFDIGDRALFEAHVRKGAELFESSKGGHCTSLLYSLKAICDADAGDAEGALDSLRKADFLSAIGKKSWHAAQYMAKAWTAAAVEEGRLDGAPTRPCRLADAARLGAFVPAARGGGLCRAAGRRAPLYRRPGGRLHGLPGSLYRPAAAAGQLRRAACLRLGRRPPAAGRRAVNLRPAGFASFSANGKLGCI